MLALLQKLAEWKARRRGAQVIIFDGAAEVERTRSFVKGVATGGVVAAVIFTLTAPTSMDANLAEEIQRRQELIEESNWRAEQAIRVASVCLATAQNLERTLAGYQTFLGNRTGSPIGAPPVPLPLGP